MERINEIREEVARTLEARGFDNREFLRQIRAGEQDDGPFMTGAFACARVYGADATIIARGGKA